MEMLIQGEEYLEYLFCLCNKYIRSSVFNADDFTKQGE